MSADDDYADLVALHEDTGGREGRLLSSVQLADWLRKRKGVSVGHTTIDRYVATQYGRRSLSQP